VSLSEEQFERIVGNVDPSAIAEQEHRIMLPDGTFTTDRRSETRIPFGQRAKIRPDSPDHAESWSTVMLQDISPSGLCFLSEEAQAIDARFVLCLKEQSGELRCVRCSVQRCEPGGFGGTSFAIGAKFLHIIPNHSEQQAASPAIPAEQPLSDPFDAFGPMACADEEEPTPQKKTPRSGPITRAARVLNPAKLLSHFRRDYDDFSTTGSGSKLPEGALSDIAKTMESAPARKQPAPAVPISEYDASQPRRSSIFLYAQPSDHADPAAAPAIETKAPVKMEVSTMSQPTVVETPPAMPIARETMKTAPEPLDYPTWAKRDLRDRRYVYMWASELSTSPYSGAPRVMVLIGAAEKGTPELIALQATSLSNPSTWKKLLFNVVRRGLTKPPRLAIADPSLDFWSALAAFSPGSGKQFCWDHQITHVLSLLPKGMQRLAEKELRQISTLPNHEEAATAFDMLREDFQTDAPKAAQFLQQNKEAMLRFYTYPAEDRTMLKTCAPTHEIFEANGPLKFDESLSMDETLAALLKLAQAHKPRNSAESPTPLAA
jgi:hypothetical protein